MPARRRRPLLPARLFALALACLIPGLAAAPARAQSCDDPDASLDLNLRVQACEDILSRVYDRATFTHLVFNLGRSYRLLGNTEAALPVLTEALRYNPKNEWYWAELGLLYLDFGEPGTAAAMYTEARRLAPENPWLAVEQAEAWVALGLASRCLENMDLALEGFAGMIEEAWAHRVRGQCLAQAGRHAEAVEAFSTALAIEPTSADAMGLRAVSQHAMGQYEALLADSAALFDPGMGIEVTPEWELAVRGLRIEALVFLSRADEVIAEVAAVRGRFPGSDLAAINLQAWALFLIGNLEEADRAALPIRNHAYPEDITGYMKDTLGQIDLALGRREAAETALLDAAWYDPGIAQGWLPALIAQGYLPQTRTADDILLALIDCMDEKGAECRVAPLPVDASKKAALPARPDPGPSEVPAPADAPAGDAPAGDAPAFEGPPDGAPAETPAELPPEAPAAAAEEEGDAGSGGLGTGPKPVRPASP